MGLFSLLKKTESSAPVRSSREEAVRRAVMIAVPAGAGWNAVTVRGMAETGIWPSFAVDFLTRCGEFKPLSRHMEDYAEYHSIDSSQMREIQHWAGRMIEAGLLIGLGDLVERCAAAGAGQGAPVSIGNIVIPTAGNEERLRRVIGTFARNARDYGRSPEITVSCNGAPGAGALIASLAQSETVKITLVTDADRAGYGAALAKRAGVDPAIVEFALGDPFGTGFACGANRNALLLRNAGRPYLSLDDDTACEITEAPGKGREQGLAVFSSRDAFERWFYPTYAEAYEGRTAVACDYLGLHESLLGQSVNALVGREAKLEFTGASDELIRRLQETDGRIVATFTGHYGHPGIPTSYYYLTYRGNTLERLIGRGEKQYRAFMSSGGVCALVPRTAVADASLSPGMAFGVDARMLIPPFPPVMHAEDFVWGAAVWECCAAGFAGHLPVALRHDPGIGRGIIAPPLAGQPPVAMWEFAHILRGILCSWAPPAGMSETAARMDSLGRHLCDLAGASAVDFDEYLRGFVLQHEGDKIGFMEQCLAEESDAPDFWRRDVEEYIEQTRLALVEPDFVVPFDMRGKWSAEEARRLMQRLVLEYGRLLRAWPALFEAAREESEGGGVP